MRTMKIKNPSEKNICFVTTTYADMFHRKAVTAYNAKTGDKYVNVTVNLPKYSLDEDECFLNPACPLLIEEMKKCGYLEITGAIDVGRGYSEVYETAIFTEKFKKDFSVSLRDAIKEQFFYCELIAYDILKNEKSPQVQYHAISYAEIENPVIGGTDGDWIRINFADIYIYLHNDGTIQCQLDAEGSGGELINVFSDEKFNKELNKISDETLEKALNLESVDGDYSAEVPIKYTPYEPSTSLSGTVIMKNTRVAVSLSKEENDVYLVEADTSKSNGCLHFTHEFYIRVKMEGGALGFLGGEEIACEDIEYTPDQDGCNYFKMIHPGLYEDLEEYFSVMTGGKGAR